jgi:hypothetical protein
MKHSYFQMQIDRVATGLNRLCVVISTPEIEKQQ